MNRKRNSAEILGVLALGVVLGVAGFGARSGNPLVYDESGQSLESLFAGVIPDLAAKDSILENAARVRDKSVPCSPAPDLVQHLASWITPPSVAAYNCSGSSCSGHHMYA